MTQRLEDSLDSLDSLDSKTFMSESLVNIEQAESDLLACAAYIADTIETQEGYTEAMSLLALRYLAKGEVEHAANIADTIDDPFTQDKTYFEIAVRAFTSGNRDLAFDLIENIDDYSFKALAQGQIAMSAAEKNEFDEALEIANNMDDSSSTIAEIALRIFDAGDVPKAKELISKIDFANSRAYAYAEISSKHLKAERKIEAVNALMTALAAVDRIEFDEDKAVAFIEIANKFAEAEDTEKARSFFAKAAGICLKMDEGDNRDSLISSLGLAHARLRDFDKANEFLDEIADPMQAVSCLAGVANEHKQAGDKETCLSLLDEALEIATGADLFLARSVARRNSLLAGIAFRFAECGEFEKSIEAANAIDADLERRSAQSVLALYYAQHNEEENASKTLDEIDDGYSRAMCLVQMSEFDENRLDEAKTLAQTIQHKYHKAIALAEIAENYHLKEKHEEAGELLFESLKLTPEISDKYEKVLALSRLSAKYDRAEKDLGDEEKKVLRDIIVAS